MTWIRIHFFPVQIRDPDPHKNYMDPKHCIFLWTYKIIIETIIILRWKRVNRRSPPPLIKKLGGKNNELPPLLPESNFF